MKTYTSLRIAEHLALANSIKRKMYKIENRFISLKQKTKKEEARLEYLKIERFHSMCFNKLLSRISTECLIVLDCSKKLKTINGLAKIYKNNFENKIVFC